MGDPIVQHCNEILQSPARRFGPRVAWRVGTWGDQVRGVVLPACLGWGDDLQFYTAAGRKFLRFLLPLTPLESSSRWSGWATLMCFKFLNLKGCDSDSANGTRGVTLFVPCYGVHTPRRLHGTNARILQTAKNFRPTEGQFRHI